MPFESLEKLLQATNFKIAIIPESAQEDNFKLSSDPIKQKIYIQRIKPYLNYFDSYSGKYMNSCIIYKYILQHFNVLFDISATIPRVYPDTALYGANKMIL